MSRRNPYDLKFKLLMIGDSGVGKSCLILRFSDDQFTSSFITTIGIDFKIKTVEILGKRIRLQLWDTAGQERFRTITNAYYRGADGILLVYDVTDDHSFMNIRNWMGDIDKYTNNDKLQIWDTAGQERFRTITTAYYRGAMGILLVYDITDEQSFLNIRNWVRNIEQHANDTVEKILIGNKCDMNDERVITTNRAEELADEYGIKLFETSAKNDINVNESFVTLAKDIVDKQFQNNTNNNGQGINNGLHHKGPINISQKPKAKSSCSCELL